MSRKSSKVRVAQINPVAQVYRMVIDDVLENIKEDFIREGVDESILAELKQVCIIRNIFKIFFLLLVVGEETDVHRSSTKFCTVISS